eukprot:Gb_12690 [translate_table: standard]
MGAKEELKCAPRAEEQNLSLQGVSLSESAGFLDVITLETSVPDTCGAHPITLPCDADGRYMRTLRDGQITRHDKSGPVQSGESQLSRVSTVETEGEAAAAFENLKSAENKSQSADCKPVSPGKCDSSKLNESIVPFTDEEDCCPTCLEGMKCCPYA